MNLLNNTHNPGLRSWVDSANLSGADFPIQNLPLAVFRRRGSSEDWRGGVAIGDQIVDLAALSGSGAFTADAAAAVKLAARDSLNAFMGAGPAAWTTLRHSLSAALSYGSSLRPALEPCRVPQAAAEYQLPARINDYTDFYTSIHHATTVGRLFRPDNPLLPNYKWVPIAYHGRSSSIGVSGQSFRRPCGQMLAPGTEVPVLMPSKRLDYELELGAFVGQSNAPGEPVTIANAEAHLFGLCLLNDWSARDLQAWEYQPLGPFLAKNFATTISPWIVTMEALAPYRIAFERPQGEPQPLPYLDSPFNRSAGAFDISLQVLIESSAMRKASAPPCIVSQGNYRHAYWTLAQMLTHHTVNGCNLQPGDLIGTGTQSGPLPEEAGSLIELSQSGKAPIRLGADEQRSFLEDGDRVIFRGWCQREGAARIGFGEVSGQILPAA